MRKELRRRDRKVTSSVLDRAQVVLATCHTAGGKQLAYRQYDWIIIDEACQALEVACWIPILKAREGAKLVLAGDHLQLPPTVKSTVIAPRKTIRKRKDAGSKDNSSTATKSSITDVKSKDFSAAAPQTEAEVKAEGDDGDEGSGDAEADEAELAEKFASVSLQTNMPTRLRLPRSLETTLFSRALGMYGPGIKSLLSIQYRMNTDIMAFPNTELYEGKLSAHTSCADIRLSDLPNLSLHSSATAADEDEQELLAPVVFYDTSGCEFYETTPSPEETVLLADSKSNPHEVELVVKHLEDLFARGVHASQVTVLAPYSAQVALLHSTIRSHRFIAPSTGTSTSSSGKKNTDTETVINADEIELGTVDSMQGREKDVVVLSLVRSNAEQQVGFLAQKKRLNVAITRAKRQLVVIGDAETIAGAKDLPDRFLPNYMEWLDAHAVVHPVVATL